MFKLKLFAFLHSFMFKLKLFAFLHSFMFKLKLLQVIAYCAFIVILSLYCCFTKWGFVGFMQFLMKLGIYFPCLESCLEALFGVCQTRVINSKICLSLSTIHIVQRAFVTDRSCSDIIILWTFISQHLACLISSIGRASDL